MKRKSKVQCAAGLYVITQTIYKSHDAANNDDRDKANGADSIIGENSADNIGQNNDDDVGGNDGDVIENENGENDIDVGNGSDEDDEMYTRYLVYRKNTAHTHDKTGNLVVRVTEAVKQQIIEQYKNGRKPKKFFYMLLNDPNIPKEDTPTHKQVSNVINAYKKSNYGDTPITMPQLTNFVSQHQDMPDDVDEAFIVSFEKSPPNVKEDKYFRFFISTRRLLSMVATATIVHSDATHKVTTELLPLIAVGVTDGNAKFHLSGITIASRGATDDYALTFNALKAGVNMVTRGEHNIQPKVLVSDGDASIHNGFKFAFYNGGGDDDDAEYEYLIIMCYFHVTLNIQSKYKFVIKSNKSRFLDDIRILHLCNREKKFDVGCTLFVKKWKPIEPEATRLVNKSFFKKNKNWYIGCGFRIPKHNNNMESFNSTMKRCQLEHQRQPLKQFLSTALTIVRQRPKEYRKGKAPFQSELVISKELMERGRALKSNFVNRNEKPNGEIDFYTFRSDMEKKITMSDVVNRWNYWEYANFEEFKAAVFDIWKITFPKDSAQWQQSTCTCPAFDKDFMCKHIIHITDNLDLLASITVEDYYDEPLFASKRGRPKRTTKALVIEK